jgi:hypothetical protein
MKFEDLIRKNENELLGFGVSGYVFEMVHRDTSKSFAVKVNSFYQVNSFII